MLTASWKLELRRVREKNATLDTAVNEYEVREESLQKKVDKGKRNEAALFRELKCASQDVEWLEREKKLLRQTTE